MKNWNTSWKDNLLKATNAAQNIAQQVAQQAQQAVASAGAKPRRGGRCGEGADFCAACAAVCGLCGCWLASCAYAPDHSVPRPEPAADAAAAHEAPGGSASLPRPPQRRGSLSVRAWNAPRRWPRWRK